MYIVIWSIGTSEDLENDSLVDHWQAFEDMPEAMEKYANLTNQEDVFTASVTDVVESTEAHYRD
jgi:hypothetical protein